MLVVTIITKLSGCSACWWHVADRYSIVGDFLYSFVECSVKRLDQGKATPRTKKKKKYYICSSQCQADKKKHLTNMYASS